MSGWSGWQFTSGLTGGLPELALQSWAQINEYRYDKLMETQTITLPEYGFIVD